MKSGALRASRKLFLHLPIAGMVLGSFLLLSPHAQAADGINQQINFQGRLLNAQGATVADGYYNVQFKIYQDGDGQSAGNSTGSPASSLKWTENHLNVNSQGVLVKNGFLSVQLGSITPFGASIDWNQDTLWLSMNVGNTNTTCTPFDSCAPDGEMLPMKRLSSSPFALNSQRVGGLTTAQLIQNTTTLQTANIALQSGDSASVGALVQGAAGQTADILQIKADGTATPLLAVSNEGYMTLQPASDSTAVFDVRNTAGASVLSVDTSTKRVGIGTADPIAELHVIAGDAVTAPTISSDTVAVFERAATPTSNANLSLLSGNAATDSGINFGDTDSETAGGIRYDHSTDTMTLRAGGDQLVIASDRNHYFANTGDHSLAIQPADGDVAGQHLTIAGGAGGNATTGGAGGALMLQGGGAAGTGNNNGGNVVISGGAGTGTGANGLVVLTTPTFSTTTSDANCYTGGALVSGNCTIALTSVNNSSAVLVGFSQSGLVATLPNPTIATAGRIIYITAANGSSDFTLSVNGGGTGNDVAMRQNTSATMIWNGSAWTAAGASSSTTLQSAYDNTLQSAGGAELVVSKTNSTNGLTIRDSSVNPVNGTLLSVQTKSAAGLFQVNSNVTEYVSNAGAEVAGESASTFPASTWSAVNSSTVARNTNITNNSIATGQASVEVVTAASAQAGVKNTLATTLVASQNYNVSFTTRLSSGTFTDMNVYFSANGIGATVPCKLNQAVTTSIWTKVNCMFTAPALGITSSNAIFIRQTGGVARTFYIDNLSVTIAADLNYATDGAVSDGTNFATNWTSVSGATVSRSTSVGNDASDSAQAITTGTGQGVRNKLAIKPLTDTLYRVTVYAASSTAGFNSLTVRYSRDAGTNFVNCADYNTQTVSSSLTEFTKITCYITTDATAASDPYLYITQSDTTARTFYVDTLSMNLSAGTTPNVQIGGGLNGGPVTLLTLDRGASAPIAGNNEALLGSMYYDTSLGKLQCYEADGWGACGSSPDSIVTISPEYTNAVLHGTGVGTMLSDICSDTLNINDGSSGQATICGTNETYNFYKWTSPQATAQTYSIYVTYQLPSNFSSFASGQTSIVGRTDSANASVEYQVYRNNPETGMTACGSPVSVANGAVTSWQTGIASGTADPSTCSFAPGHSIVFKINVTASQNASAYVSNLNFTFNNR